MAYTNERRDRHYGLRVGDIVKCKYTPDPDTLYKVVHLCALDNNGVYLQKGDQQPIRAVAEHCEIIKKVEDNG